MTKLRDLIGTNVLRTFSSYNKKKRRKKLVVKKHPQ